LNRENRLVFHNVFLGNKIKRPIVKIEILEHLMIYATHFFRRLLILIEEKASHYGISNFPWVAAMLAEFPNFALRFLITCASKSTGMMDDTTGSYF